MSDKVVIVTGSRKWRGTSLYDKLEELDPDVIVHGGARGADTMAHEWAEDHGRVAVVYFPDYDEYGRKAPLHRNRAMIHAYPDATVVACPLPGGTGTQYTMRYANDRNMSVVVVEP